MITINVPVADMKALIEKEQSDNIAINVTDAIQITGLMPSEALFGFVAWLTTREEKTVMSSTNDAAPMVELLNQFCIKHRLDEPREGWEEILHNEGIPLSPHRKVLHKDCDGLIGMLAADEKGEYPAELKPEMFSKEGEDMNLLCTECKAEIHSTQMIYLEPIIGVDLADGKTDECVATDNEEGGDQQEPT